MIISCAANDLFNDLGGEVYSGTQEEGEISVEQSHA